jgi:hypothetical protein
MKYPLFLDARDCNSVRDSGWVFSALLARQVSFDGGALLTSGPGTELPNRNVRFDGEFRTISRHAGDGTGWPSLTLSGHSGD